jgi:isoleucyl-tRNA synthetase
MQSWYHHALVGITGKAPYRAIVTHGFVLDGDGRKMSKSLGNVVSPDTIISGGSSVCNKLDTLSR